MGKTQKSADTVKTFSFTQLYRKGAAWKCPDHITVELSGTVTAESSGRSNLGRLYCCPEAIPVRTDSFKGYRGYDCRHI